MVKWGKVLLKVFIDAGLLYANDPSKGNCIEAVKWGGRSYTKP